VHETEHAIPVDPNARRAGKRAGMRVRLAMLGVLMLIALVLAAQAWQNWRTELLRSADGEIIALAGAQRLFSQRLSLLATQNASDAAPPQLARGLAEARSQAQRLEDLLLEQDVRGSEEGSRSVATVRAWATALTRESGSSFASRSPSCMSRSSIFVIYSRINISRRVALAVSFSTRRCSEAMSRSL